MNEPTAEIRDQARRIRAAVLARHGLAPGDPIPVDPSAPRLDEVTRRARVTAHWGIASEAPLIGPLIVVWRRFMRIMLRWYINPIVEQQNAFNEAATRALFDLHAANEELRAQLAEARPVAAERDEHPDPA